VNSGESADDIKQVGNARLNNGTTIRVANFAENQITGGRLPLKVHFPSILRCQK